MESYQVEKVDSQFVLKLRDKLTQNEPIKHIAIEVFLTI